MMITAAIFALSTAPPNIKNDPMLDDLEHRAVRFFWEQSNPKNGFSKDRATNSGDKDEHDVASCASVGFALTAYAIGAQRHWIPRAEALKRTQVTLRHLMTDWPHQKGWLYHFINYNTGERMWKSEASTIDTSICFAGVIVAQQYWKDRAISKDADAFAKRMDWAYMTHDGGLKPNEDTVSMGWHPESAFINARWNGWDELKMIYVQAYGASNIPTTGWAKVGRPLVEYSGIQCLVGGPLFMHQMSESFYNFKGLRDKLGYNYWVESRNACLANRQYCIDNPKERKAYGPNFWGLSACDYKDGYTAFGGPGQEGDPNEDGTITPTSAVASIQFTPDHAISFLHAMRKDHPNAWGKYGFPNGYSPTADWTDPDVIGIDLGMMMTSVENFRTGFVQKLSASHPMVKLGYKKIGFKKTSDNETLKK